MMASMATKTTAQHLQKLRDELAAIQAEIRSLQGREAGLQRAIAIVSDDPAFLGGGGTHHKRRSPIKDIVLRLLEENAERGLVAVEIVDLARRQGITLDRNSVSSLLSRFKKEGVLDYDGKVYRPTRPFRGKIMAVA